ncbi:MAG: omptin family outer membrane protease [Chlamydiales bacterium]|nr:omptin family outer membrane protease [Chlamydiales bacterium]
MKSKLFIFIIVLFYVVRVDSFCLQPVGLEVSLFTGYVYGGSNEIVFTGKGSSNPLQKVSELNWRVRNLWVLGANLQQRLFDNQFFVRVDGWSRVSSGYSTMVDRDWENFDEPDVMTDISTSTKTILPVAYLVDAAIGYYFYQTKGLEMSVEIGYEYSQYYWKSFGARYSYDQGDTIGTLPQNELLIAYQQLLSVPYIGLNFDWTMNWLDLKIFGKYTHLAYVKDKDNHVLRKILFVDRFHAVEFWSVGLDAKIPLWKWIDLDLKYVFEGLVPSVGNATMREDGGMTYTQGGAGISHFHNLFTMGVTAHF